MIGLHNTSAFGTCIQKYVIERYVCLIVFMVIAQTHVQPCSYCSLLTPTTWTYVHLGTVWTCVHSVGTVCTYVCTVTTVWTYFAGS